MTVVLRLSLKRLKRAFLLRIYLSIQTIKPVSDEF
jgi:hypothetical protein